MRRQFEINRGNGSDRIYTKALSMGSQLHAVSGIVAGDMRNNDNPALCHCHYIFEDKLPLFHRMIDALTGRPADVKPRNSLSDQILRKSAYPLRGDRTVRCITSIKRGKNALVLCCVFHSNPFFLSLHSTHCDALGKVFLENDKHDDNRD